MQEKSDYKIQTPNSLEYKNKTYHVSTKLIGDHYLSNIVAAIGVGQIKGLNKTIKQIKILHEKYIKALSDLPITFQEKNKSL